MGLKILGARSSLPRLLFLLDFLWISFASCLAQAFRTGQFVDSFRPALLSAMILPAVVCMALWAVAARKLSLDDLQDFTRPSAILSRVTTGVLVLVPLAMGAAFMARSMYSRLSFLYLGLLLILGFTAIRILVRAVVLRFRSQFVKRTVIIGSGRIACEIADKINCHRELMRDLVAFLHPANREAPNFPAAQRSQSVGSLSLAKVLQLLKDNNISEVILAGADPNTANVHQLTWQCRQNNIEVCVIPHSYDLYSSHARILDLGGLPLVKVESHVPDSLELILKRLTDIVLVAPMMVLSLPITMAIAIAVYARGERALRSEVRCGRNGQPFRMLRFNIPRHATELGKFDAFLDRLSLTELPQLWNVARGDMSLVGPRPEDSDRVRNYSDWQRQRLSVRPGITGLAQVQGLRDEHSSDEKSRYDLQYIHHWSPLMDVSLIFQTVWTLCCRIKSTRESSGTSKHLDADPPAISISADAVRRSGC